MDAYQKGLNGPQVVWVNRKYHGHQVLPNNIMETLESYTVHSPNEPGGHKLIFSAM